jgi:toxin CptA
VQFPIIIGLHRSFFLDRLGLTVSIVAAASLAATPWPWPFRILGPLLCLLAWAWSRKPLTAGQSLIIEQPGQFIRQTADGERQRLRCLPGATVHPWLTVVRLRDEAGKTVTLVFTVDNISAADFRRLRTVMRWQGACADAAGDA